MVPIYIVVYPPRSYRTTRARRRSFGLVPPVAEARGSSLDRTPSRRRLALAYVSIESSELVDALGDFGSDVCLELVGSSRAAHGVEERLPLVNLAGERVEHALHARNLRLRALVVVGFRDGRAQGGILLRECAVELAKALESEFAGLADEASRRGGGTVDGRARVFSVDDGTRTHGGSDAPRGGERERLRLLVRGVGAALEISGATNFRRAQALGRQ